MLNFGLVGVNTSHADAFSRIFNGDGETPAVIDNARISHIWGGDQERVDALAAKHDIATKVADPREMIGGIDAALIVDDTGLGAKHAELARPFVDAGLPVYVDKPMTTVYADAVALFDLAEQRGAPVMSCSALRFPVELAANRAAFDDLGKISSVVSVGPGEWFNYGVHAVELLGAITADRPAWVQRFAMDEKDVAVIGYESGQVAVVETLRDAAYAFHITAYGEKGLTAMEVVDMPGFYANTMREVVRMVETKRSPLTREQTLDVMAILHAGDRSAETGQRVTIDEIRGGSQ
ncbi:MAG TPA: Gfo/Idh/MocA family oxidoreductase [Thermomicrobiales bacterium]|nr:Gfo/Idh/MocA family oxidoreductase [Thermomicrobiales bacterium]